MQSLLRSNSWSPRHLFEGLTSALRAPLRIVLLGCLFCVPAASEGLRHPQDGPHLDLRAEISTRGLMLSVQLNLACLDELVEAPREDLNSVHPAEWEGLAKAITRLIGERNQVVVDGVAVLPVRRDFEVFEPDPSLVALFPKFGPRALTSMRLDLDYPAKTQPSEVHLTWDLFPSDAALAAEGEDGPPLEVLLRLAADDRESIVAFTPEQPEFTWRPDDGSGGLFTIPHPPRTRNMGLAQISVVSVACLGLAGLLALGSMFKRSPKWLTAVLLVLIGSYATRSLWLLPLGSPEINLPSETEAVAIFEPLHSNLYRAFDYTEESDVFEALEESVEGALLEELYGEVYASLIQEENDRARGRVVAVKPLETQIGERGFSSVSHSEQPEQQGSTNAAEEAWPQFQVKARWQVEGVVVHMGHTHWRTQEALANYTVRGSKTGWRIAESEILEQFVVSASPTRPADGDELPQEF